MWIGAKPIAVSPQYCDCGFLQEEIMSRLMIRNVVGGVRDWLLNGFLVLLAVGLVIVAGLGQRAGMPSGWRRLSIVIAALSLVGVAMTFFEVGPFGALLFLLIGVYSPLYGPYGSQAGQACCGPRLRGWLKPLCPPTDPSQHPDWRWRALRDEFVDLFRRFLCSAQGMELPVLRILIWR